MKKVEIILKYGDKGQKVTQAQKALQKAGSSIKVNGEYTVGMISAVKCFQKKNKLAVTGVIDAKTWEKLTGKAPAAKKAVKKPAVKK